jgi:hypothetical protein
MDDIREFIATIYLACAYAGGPAWLERANELLIDNANDPEISPGAARLLNILADNSARLFCAEEAPEFRGCIFSALASSALH